MTGQAEAQRQILPDGSKPELHNGDFEEVMGDPPVPDWVVLPAAVDAGHRPGRTVGQETT